jgi:peptidoglycan/LPS O-acetylase OafA/YrhL
LAGTWARWVPPGGQNRGYGRSGRIRHQCQCWVWAWDAGALHRIDGTFLARWHEFAVGLAVYWRLNAAGSRAGRRGVELGLAALLGLAVALGAVSAAATAAFGLTLIGLRRFDARWRGLAWLAPLRACGRRSYSLYLIHVPACLLTGAAARGLGVTGFWGSALLAVPAMTAASVGAAWVFYGRVERPFAEPPAARRPGPAPRPVGPALVPA